MVRTTPRGWLPASPPPDAARAGLITNTAEPGIGNAYRLTPEGATFDVEPTLELRLAEEDVAGTSGDFLGIAT
ncbi:MAG: hypothetical protein JNK04_15445, partial [Myxococcales bacterium]|nr:hypothetical protein [Myxococcales bacterium]